jgi:hypothetical protein
VAKAGTFLSDRTFARRLKRLRERGFVVKHGPHYSLAPPEAATATTLPPDCHGASPLPSHAATVTPLSIGVTGQRLGADGDNPAREATVSPQATTPSGELQGQGSSATQVSAAGRTRVPGTGASQRRPSVQGQDPGPPDWMLDEEYQAWLLKQPVGDWPVN